MRRENCDTCWWFEPNKNERPLYDGRCTRHPPTAHINGGIQFTIWPDVMHNDRCGKWYAAKEQS